jgi:hypothetical protein
MILISLDFIVSTFIKLHIKVFQLHIVTNFAVCAFLFYFYRLIIDVVEYFDLDHLLINFSTIMDIVERIYSLNAKTKLYIYSR